MRMLVAGMATLIALAGLTPARATLSQNVAQYLPLIGSAQNGGATFTRQCPPDQVLTGARVRLGRVIDAIGIKCRAVLTSGSLGAESDVGSLIGGTSGLLAAGSCPAGSVIVGQAGSATPSGIAQFVLRCRAWDAATRSWGGATTALIQLLAGANPTVVVASQAQALRESVDCSHQTQPAIQFRGRAGTIVDALGVTCDEP
ncbi:MAG TPA: hypothetical protein VJ717_15905 [Gemmatimonadaceae bacterium]|nr:hypothetical protein [Gemmatimonadaceae bacterium]